jgi:hypothetical protein
MDYNPLHGIVRVMIDAMHDKTLWLHLQPFFKLTRVLSGMGSSVNRCLTLRLNKCYAQPNTVGYMDRSSHA